MYCTVKDPSTNVECLCPDMLPLIRYKLVSCIPAHGVCMGFDILDLKKPQHQLFILSVLHFLVKYSFFTHFPVTQAH